MHIVMLLGLFIMNFNLLRILKTSPERLIHVMLGLEFINVILIEGGFNDMLHQQRVIARIKMQPLILATPVTVFPCWIIVLSVLLP